MAQTFAMHGWDNREVRVHKQQLLSILKNNRENHIAEYQKALAGYKDAALEKISEITDDLHSKVNLLRDGRMITTLHVSFTLPAPESHEKSYDQIIKMTEMSVDDIITLTAGQFGCFVMDDWEWKETWSMSNAGYISRTERAGAR